MDDDHGRYVENQLEIRQDVDILTVSFVASLQIRVANSLITIKAYQSDIHVHKP
jgi:hypothetical protein